MLLHTLLFGSSLSLAAGEAPRVDLHFPPPDTLTDSATIHVTGSASDPDGIAWVRVNGVYATSLDGFAHWSAEVPLSLGSQTLSVASADLVGTLNLDAASVVLERDDPFLLAARSFTRDPLTGLVYAVDFELRGIFEIDPQSGARRVISSQVTGSGPQLTQPHGIAMAVPGQSVFVADEPNELFRVDLATGARALVTGNGVGAGPSIALPQAVCYVPALGRLFVTTPNAVFTVDPNSGDRVKLSGVGVGGGAGFKEFRGLAYDASGKRLFTLDGSDHQLLAIDESTGFRTVLAGPGLGSGPELGATSGLVFDASAQRVLTIDTALREVLAIDLATGDRTTLAASGAGWAGGAYDTSRAGQRLWFDPVTKSPWTLEFDSLERIDPATGVQQALTANRRGSGLALRLGTPQLAYDEAHGHWLAFGMPQVRWQLFTIDPSDGDRVDVPIDDAVAHVGYGTGLAYDRRAGRVIVHRIPSFGTSVLASLDTATGACTDFSTPYSTPTRDLAYDSQNRRTFVATYDSVRAFDERHQSWSVVTSASIGSGPALHSVGKLAYDPGHDTLYATEEAPAPQVFAIDVPTGVRTVIASKTVGSGPVLIRPLAVEHDLAHARLVVADPNWSALVEIDLTTLERRILSKTAYTKVVDALGQFARDVGAGPALLRPTGVSVDSARNVAVARCNWPMNGLLCVELGSGDRVLLSR
ncbi:MAG: hypothetical protein L6Q99_18550 [Planctomycetes bacterium]|nr:hypothetical protein [Planctomycetota bacterium]